MQLEFLRDLYQRPLGCASVYLDITRADATARERVALRWRAAREELAKGPVDGATLDALDELITGPAHNARGIAAFARDGEIVFARPMPDPPRQEIARYAPLPHLMPMLAQSPPAVPHLRVSADRAGGALVEVLGQYQTAPTRVDGEGWPVHKTSVGGWSQNRYQRSAEEAWRENEKEFAAAVAAAAERIGAELIMVAGDIKARSLLIDRLGRPWADKIVVVEKEVPADSRELAEAAEQEIRSRAERATRERLDRVRTQLGRDRAAEGFSGVVARLRDTQVSDLLLADRPSSAAKLWFGPDVTQVGTTQDEVRDRGAAEPVEDRADAVLIRELVLTGAELHFLPDAETLPRDGIAALLRFAY
jgi:Bacterial archaeo-eukaryotic release factor family 2